MKKTAQTLALLQQKKAQLRIREKQLKADLEAQIANENRKLRLAIGGCIIEQLTEPAIRRALSKVLPSLRPDYRERLSGLMTAAVNTKQGQAQINFSEPAQPATPALPKPPPAAASGVAPDPGT
ncbi:hypothetical protein ESB00_17390 [Oleiharenicola lentus]|uniref:Uncharacterized protein n=1 Tax=Oleiharenicola lentus TaxID=2508720 RepID=A0A4V1M618_9BACT|nr:hypothetical protein [Oleiharenicola lentus]RXK53466.1 hypothetical protein ESB00_17390 [Oleiharenicola lentus]